MAERSFVKEVKKLRLGDGEVFQGEGILAVTKALLQSGVSYVGGYQGAPISHLMDVLSDAKEILDELGVHFESTGSEATAAAMLSASINYPLRGAVTWKSTVGTNVASDALANLASAGVKGGALIVVGEDYGEGASIMQERTHAFAMKSQMWLLDPRPNLASITEMVEQGFELSEASSTPVMLMLRVRACHVTGEFLAKNNVAPEFGLSHPVQPKREIDRIILPPNIFQQEQDKVSSRWPRAEQFIREKGLNELFPGKAEDTGIILQGGLYNNVIRALQRLGLADVYGGSDIPLYVLNVTYPLVPDEVAEFCRDKAQVLIVEEGQPDYIEQNISNLLRKAEVSTRLFGKDILPKAGEYTGQVLLDGVANFLMAAQPAQLNMSELEDAYSATQHRLHEDELEELDRQVTPRPSGLCTGCPERPFFSAVKQVQKELGEFHISADIGCHSFATLPPFNVGNTIMGYGLSLASSSGIHKALPHRAISVMGDGGFWHNGLSSGVASAVFNKHDGVLVVVQNGYSSATGGQDIPSSMPQGVNKIDPARIIASSRHLDAATASNPESQPIEEALKGAGVKWVRTVRTYDIARMKNTLREAMTTKVPGLKAIVAEGECMLNRQRRIKPIIAQAIRSGVRTVKARFYIDPDTCTGDHACIRLSGCPSLTIRENPDPLRLDPVSYVDNSCVGCGVCGSNVHAAVLCPSFAQVDVIHNPNRWDRLIGAFRHSVIQFLQQRQQSHLRHLGL